MEDKQLRESIAALMKDKSQRDALAQLFTEFLQPSHIITDFVGLLLNTKNMKPGDALLKKVRKGIKVRTLVPGAMHLASEITVSERMNYILDGADVKVTANEWELASGELGTVAEIKNEMLAKLRDFYMGKVFTALTTVWTAGNTPDNYTHMGHAIDAATLKDAIDHINETTAGVKAVVGMRADLTPITVFGAGWDDGTSTELQEVPENIREIMQTGWLGKWYGAPIIALNQVYNNPEDYEPMLPTGKILVIGQNVGDFITYGSVSTKEYTDPRPTPPQWYYELWQQFGMIIDNAMGIYVLET